MIRKCAKPTWEKVSRLDAQRKTARSPFHDRQLSYANVVIGDRYHGSRSQRTLDSWPNGDQQSRKRVGIQAFFANALYRGIALAAG